MGRGPTLLKVQGSGFTPCDFARKPPCLVAGDEDPSRPLGAKTKGLTMLSPSLVDPLPPKGPGGGEA